MRVTKNGRRFKVDERRAVEASRLSNWEPNHADTEGEHTCHMHPLGSTEVKRYWCGHTCMDEGVCRKYMAVWLMTHPLQVVRHLRGLNYRGLSR